MTVISPKKISSCRTYPAIFEILFPISRPFILTSPWNLYIFSSFWIGKLPWHLRSIIFRVRKLRNVDFPDPDEPIIAVKVPFHSLFAGQSSWSTSLKGVTAIFVKIGEISENDCDTLKGQIKRS